MQNKQCHPLRSGTTICTLFCCWMLSRSVQNTQYQSVDFKQRLAHCIHIFAYQIFFIVWHLNKFFTAWLGMHAHDNSRLWFENVMLEAFLAKLQLKSNQRKRIIVQSSKINLFIYVHCKNIYTHLNMSIKNSYFYKFSKAHRSPLTFCK